MENDHSIEATTPLIPHHQSLEINQHDNNTSRRHRTLFYIVTPIFVLIPLLFVLAVLLPNPRHDGPSPILPLRTSSREPEAFTILRFVTQDGSPVPYDDEWYGRLRNGVFLTTATTTVEDERRSPYTVNVSGESVEFGQQLEISWNHETNEAMDDDLILALSCGDDDNKMMDDVGTNLVDAATLTHVKSTHIHQNPGSEIKADRRWILSSFPIIYSNACVFSLLRHSPPLRYEKNLSDDNKAAAEQQQQQPQHVYHILAQSQIINLSTSQDVPTSIHLGLSSNPNQRYVQFTAGISGTPIVEIARRTATDTPSSRPLTVEDFVKVTGGTSVSYGAEEMCGPPANSMEGFVNPGHLYTVLVEGLEVDAEYVYRVGLAMGQGVRWSDYFEFKTDPAITIATNMDNNTTPVSTFLAVADQGVEQSLHTDDNGTPATSPSASRLVVETHLKLKAQQEGRITAARDVANLLTSIVNNETISSIHHMGDLSYANGAGHTWDRYMSMIQPYASRVPVMVGVGNHEYDHVVGGGGGKDPSGVVTDGGFQPYWGEFNEASGGECGVPLSKRFAVPENGNGVFWYSFNHPLVHTVMLSTEHNMTATSPQYEWLRNDLEKVNRTITPWVVVEMHRPMYDKFQENDAIAVAMQYEVEDLFYTNSVDLVISGHVHYYLRSCDGLFRGKCDNGGPTYVSVGTGGAPLDGGHHVNIPWVEKYDGEHFGVGKASVLGASSLLWQFVAVGGEVTDEYMIRRDRASRNH